jgi:hypothetical protein
MLYELRVIELAAVNARFAISLCRDVAGRGTDEVLEEHPDPLKINADPVGQASDLRGWVG